MPKPTAAERTHFRWCVEKNPGALYAVLRKMAQDVANMDPRLRELLQEELAKEQAGSDDNAEYLKVRTSDAAKRFDVTQKTIREWAKRGKPPKRVRQSNFRGYVLVHPDDWKT